MIQDWMDTFREWRATRHQAAGNELKEAARHRMDRRDWWRRSIGRPWQEAICWTCIVVLGLLLMSGLFVLAVRR